MPRVRGDQIGREKGNVLAPKRQVTGSSLLLDEDHTLNWDDVFDTRMVKVRDCVIKILDKDDELHTLTVRGETGWSSYSWGPYALHGYERAEKILEKKEFIPTDVFNVFIPRCNIKTIEYVESDEKDEEIAWRFVGMRNWTWFSWVLFGGMTVVTLVLVVLTIATWSD